MTKPHVSRYLLPATNDRAISVAQDLRLHADVFRQMLPRDARLLAYFDEIMHAVNGGLASVHATAVNEVAASRQSDSQKEE